MRDIVDGFLQLAIGDCPVPGAGSGTVKDISFASVSECMQVSPPFACHCSPAY